jgi:hypothetical protein
VAPAMIRRVPILDESPEDRQVALTKRLPSLSNYLATDVSAWAWHMTIVRDNALWRETDAASWEDYCIRIVGKPLDWCGWIIGGYEVLRGVRTGPIPEGEALEVGRAAAEVMARANPERDLPGQGARRDLGLPDNIRKSSLSNTGGTSAAYLAARIKRDHPEIAAAVERGEYPSMRQAALAAGIVKPPNTLRIAQRLWANMTPEERTAFEGFIAEWYRQNAQES